MSSVLKDLLRFDLQSKTNFFFFSLVKLEVGSMRKGRARWRFGVPGENWVCLNPRGIKSSKVVWEGQNYHGRRRVQGVRGMFESQGQGITLSLLRSLSAILVWQEGGSLQPLWTSLKLPDAPGRGVKEAHKGLPSRKMMSLIPSFSAREAILVDIPQVTEKNVCSAASRWNVL